MFNDGFSGVNGNPPHRGRWIPYFDHNSAILYKAIEIENNMLHILVSGDMSQVVKAHALTRAEFKTPFTVRFSVIVQHAAGQDPEHFAFLLNSPDPQDGFLSSSHLYGRHVVILAAYSSVDGRSYCWAVSSSGGYEEYSADNAWVAGTEYFVTLEIVPYRSIYRGQLTILDEFGATMFSLSDIDIYPTRYGTMRCEFMAKSETFVDDVISEFYVDNFSVSMEIR